MPFPCRDSMTLTSFHPVFQSTDRDTEALRFVFFFMSCSRHIFLVMPKWPLSSKSSGPSPIRVSEDHHTSYTISGAIPHHV